MVSQKKTFFMFFPLKAIGANGPQGGAIFDPRGMTGRMYKEDHYTSLHTKYESSVSCCFRRRFFKVFLMTPRAGPVWIQGQNRKALGRVVL